MKKILALSVLSTRPAALSAAASVLKVPAPTAVSTMSLACTDSAAMDVKAGKVKTVQGSDLTVATAGGVMVDGAKVTATDIVADNGVIHVIDSVVVPK